MPKDLTRAEVASEVKKKLVAKGFDTNSSEYLGELFADSPRGESVQKGGRPTRSGLTPAATCGDGAVPVANT